MTSEQLVALLLESAEELTAEVLRQVWGTPGYDEEHMRPEDLAGKVNPNLRWVIRCLATTGPPAEPAMASAREIGHSRALQGVPVDALTHAWAAAERVVLDRLLGYADAVPVPVPLSELRRTVRRLGAVVGELTRCSVAAYRHAQQEVTAHYDQLTTDLVARLSGEQPADPETIRRRAQLVGSDPIAPHTAVAVGLPAIDEPAAYLRTQRHLLAVMAATSHGRILVGRLDEHPLILVPTPDGPDRLTSLLTGFIQDRHRPDPVVLGVSEHAAPLHAVAPACREAQLAMQVGMRLGWTDRVVRFGTVAPEALLVRNPDLADLLTDRLHELWDRPELVETIRVYLRHGMSARATARALYLHPNTVQYRLKTLRRILGRPLSDAIGLADVILALRGTDLQAAGNPDRVAGGGTGQSPGS
ncbi:MAG: hypothetical protein GEV12_16300 [Micromonosporaceae bacterium]|nr:hypothetical protein [Micromonosporaceae bacterium]